MISEAIDARLAERGGQGTEAVTAVITAGQCRPGPIRGDPSLGAGRAAPEGGRQDAAAVRRLARLVTRPSEIRLARTSPGSGRTRPCPDLCKPHRALGRAGHGVTTPCPTGLARQTVFYEPPQDTGRRPLTGWMTNLARMTYSQKGALRSPGEHTVSLTLAT